MSLFGRRRNFGFSRGLGDAIANPSYMGALGEVGMLAGSLPQRLKEKERQAEEMKILQSGDPQQIINYSLTEAARLNDPELLAAAQQAQKRLSVQTDLGKVNNLVSLLSNPEAVNSDGVKLAGNVEARNAIYSDIRNIFAGNENLPDDGGEQFIERGTQNFATGMSRRATTLVSSNPSASADDLVQRFEQQFPGQGKYVRDAYTKSKRLEEGVIDLDLKAFRRKQLPINLAIERDISNKILSGTYNIEEVKALQEQLYQSYVDMEDGESAARVSTLVLDLQQAVADKAISDAQALETASNQAQEAFHSELMSQVFAPNATGDFDQNYEDGLRSIKKAMKDDGLIYDSNEEAKLRELYTNRRDTAAFTRGDDPINDIYDVAYVAKNRPQFEEMEEFLRLEARINDLVSKGRKLEANDQSLNSTELSELKGLNAQMGALVLKVKDRETEAKFGENAVAAKAKTYAAMFANDLTQRPDLITVEGESSFFFPDNELFFTDQPIRTLGPDGRNYYQIAQELLAEPDSANSKAFISNIEQQLREDKTLIRDMNVDNIQTVVKSAIDSLGILDADDKRTIARIAERQARDNMASSLAQIAIMGELETIIRKTEGLDANRRDSEGRVVRQDYIQDLMAKAMKGLYTKNPSAYAQAVEAYKTRDEREYQTRRDQLLKNAFTRGAIAPGSRNAMR